MQALIIHSHEVLATDFCFWLLSNAPDIKGNVGNTTVLYHQLRRSDPLMKKQIFTVLLFHYETYSFFPSTCQAQVWTGYRQNPRTEARVKNGLVFLLNTIVAYLGLTLVVSFQTQGPGPRFRSALPLEQGTWDQGMSCSQQGTVCRETARRHLLPYPEQQGWDLISLGIHWLNLFTQKTEEHSLLLLKPLREEN